MTRESVVRQFIYTTREDAAPVLALQELMLEMVPSDTNEKCVACPISEECYAPVPGVGNVHSPIVLIGRNPGAEEDTRGIPFCGKGGQLLDTFIKRAELDRSQLYITNLVKCFTEDNRPPKPGEIQICMQRWLQPELFILLPFMKLIVTFGEQACEALTGQTMKVARLNMQTYPVDGPLGGVNIIGCIHPRAALRAPRFMKLLYDDAAYVKAKCRELGILPAV